MVEVEVTDNVTAEVKDTAEEEEEVKGSWDQEEEDTKDAWDASSGEEEEEESTPDKGRLEKVFLFLQHL